MTLRYYVTFFLFFLQLISVRAQWSFMTLDYNSNPNKWDEFYIHCIDDSLIHAGIYNYERFDLFTYPELVTVDKNGTNIQSLSLGRIKFPGIPVGLAWTNASSYMVMYDTTARNTGSINKLSRAFEFRDSKSHQVLWEGSGTFRVPEFAEKDLYVFSGNNFWLQDINNDHLLKISVLNGDTQQVISGDHLRQEFQIDSSFSLMELKLKGPTWRQSDTAYAFISFIKFDSVLGIPSYEEKLALIDLTNLTVVSNIIDWPDNAIVDCENNYVISDTTKVDWSNNEFDRYILGDNLIDATRDTLLTILSSTFNPDTANAYPLHAYYYKSRGDYQLYAEFLEDNLTGHPIFQSIFNLKVRLHLYKHGNLLYKTTIVDTTANTFFDTYLSDMYLFPDGKALLNLGVDDSRSIGRLLMVDEQGNHFLTQRSFSSTDDLPLKVYPTVVDGFVHIEGSSPFTGFEIFTADGKVILRGNLNATNTQVDLSHLKPGRYTMLFEGEGAATIRSILKK